MKVNLIIALCQNRGIGYKNNIPWRIPRDLLHFSKCTTGLYGQKESVIKHFKEKYKIPENIKIKKNAVIMGKNTWNSLPFYPEGLKNRDNYILSTSLDNIKKRNKNNDLIMSFSSISQLIQYMDNLQSDLKEVIDYKITEEVYENSEIKENNEYNKIWVIGGSQIIDLFIEYQENKKIIIDEIYITYIDKYYECDVFFPKLNLLHDYYVEDFNKRGEDDDVMVYYIKYKKRIGTFGSIHNPKNILSNILEKNQIINDYDIKLLYSLI